MKELWQTKTRIALPTMIAVQSFGTMCSFAGSVVAVQAAADLGVKSTMIGVYTATLYIVAMVSGLAAGGFLTRFGVIRTCQWALLCAVFGLWIGGAIQAWPAALVAAVLIGIGQGPQNPASSRILARHTPAR
ncbi:MAG: MFS transporter, partial [Pseudomonadota bacterium]|nr:MFS transporter [Pseudomonadota bacterium]